MEQISTTTINLTPREWNGQRVVTFADIDEVHQRPKGTASRNFKANRKRFIAGTDYVILSRNDLMDENRPL